MSVKLRIINVSCGFQQLDFQSGPCVVLRQIGNGNSKGSTSSVESHQGLSLNQALTTSHAWCKSNISIGETDWKINVISPVIIHLNLVEKSSHQSSF